MKFTAGVTIETNHDANRGVLGCFVAVLEGKRTDDLLPGDICVLTAGHVLFPGFATLPDVGVFSPDFSSCCSSGDRMATVALFSGGFELKNPAQYTGCFNDGVSEIHGATMFRPASIVNCGLAKIDPGVEVHNAWPDGTVIAGDYRNDPAFSGPSELGIGKGPDFGTMLPTSEQLARLWAPGRGVVYGTMIKTPSSTFMWDPDHLLYQRDIGDLATASDESIGIKPLIDQFLFLPRPTPMPSDTTIEDAYARGVPILSDDDAGTIVINSSGHAIAMLSRVMATSAKAFENLSDAERNSREFGSATNVGVCNPLKWVMDHLKVQVPTVATGYTNTKTARGVQVPAAIEDVRQRAGLDRLRSGLRASRRGTILLGKVVQHRREIKRLFATVRAIQASWRELRGAAFYHHCVESVRDPAHRIPDAIDGVTRERLVEALLPLVQHHASRALARDIERYRAWAIAMLLPVRSLGEVPAIAARRSP